MPKPSDAHVEVSARLLAYASVAEVPDTAAAAGRVYEALFRMLTPIVGAAGAHALFVRSMKLAKTGFPGLRNVDVPAEPSDDQAKFASYLVGCLRVLEPAAGAEAAVGLFAELLSLLTNFIGEPLVWQILQKAFPGIDRTAFKESM